MIIDIINNFNTYTPYYPGLIYSGSFFLFLAGTIFEGIGYEDLFKAVNSHNKRLFYNK